MIDIEHLKQLTDIVDVARDLGLNPKRSGVNYVAHCPAHEDTGRPNLTLNAKKQPGAICFSCGWKADAIDLVAKVRGIEKGEAIRWLADRVGLRDESKPAKSGLGYKPKTTPAPSYPKPAPLPEPVATQSAPIVNVSTETSAGISTEIPERAAAELARYPHHPPDVVEVGDRLVMTWIFNKPPKTSLRVKVYEALLSHAGDLPADAIAWLHKKGLTAETATAFGLRWLNWETADRELRKTFGDEALIGLGLLAIDKETKKPIGLRFKNHRLLFPFWLTVADRRWPVYLQARNIHTTDPKFRFDNPSAPCPIPYNFDAVAQARADDAPVFIVEGLTDTLTLAQSGRFPCGIPGAQRWKADWAKSFADLDVYLTRDADQAGDQFVLNVTKSFVDAGLHAPKVVKLPAGQDVTDLFTGQQTKKTVAADQTAAPATPIAVTPVADVKPAPGDQSVRDADEATPIEDPPATTGPTTRVVDLNQYSIAEFRKKP
jgi:DNA primase